MIVENKGEKYYVPDEIGNDKSKSVAEIFQAAIPYQQYLLSINKEKYLSKLSDIKEQIIELEKEPDEIMIPNDDKFSQMNMLEDRKKEINKILGIK